MTADLLRRAAAKLREHADRIPPAENEEPWYRTEPPQYGFWRVLCEVAPNDAEFVALMSPAVGLALAEVLDRAADVRQHEGEGTPEGGWAACIPKWIEPSLLALVSSVLREEKS